MRPAFLLLCVILLVSTVAAHSVETKFVIKSDSTYNIKFSTDPKFPLAQKKVHLDVEIWNNEGQIIADADVELEIRKGDAKETLALHYKHEHYAAEHVFLEEGAYTITPLMDGEPLAMEFTIDVDSFGQSGLIRSGVILLLLIILAYAAYHDCKRRE